MLACRPPQKIEYSSTQHGRCVPAAQQPVPHQTLPVDRHCHATLANYVRCNLEDLETAMGLGFRVSRGRTSSSLDPTRRIDAMARRSLLLGSLTALVSATSLVACTSAPEPTEVGVLNQAMLNAEETSDANVFGSPVVTITATLTDGSKVKGSGVLIETNVVLTAAHVVDDFLGASESMLVFTGNRRLTSGTPTNGQIAMVRAMQTHYRYVPNQYELGIRSSVDLGLIALDRALTTTPATYALSPSGFPQDVILHSGILHILGSDSVTVKNSNVFTALASLPMPIPPFGEKCQIAGAFYTAQAPTGARTAAGDSGAPIFDSSSTVIGVHSSSCPGYVASGGPFYGIEVDVSPNSGWLWRSTPKMSDPDVVFARVEDFDGDGILDDIVLKQLTATNFRFEYFLSRVGTGSYDIAATEEEQNAFKYIARIAFIPAIVGGYIAIYSRGAAGSMRNYPIEQSEVITLDVALPDPAATYVGLYPVDVNRDLVSDLVAITSDGSHQLLRGSSSETQMSLTYEPTWPVAMLNLDNDGIPDFVSGVGTPVLRVNSSALGGSFGSVDVWNPPEQILAGRFRTSPPAGLESKAGIEDVVFVAAGEVVHCLASGYGGFEICERPIATTGSSSPAQRAQSIRAIPVNEDFARDVEVRFEDDHIEYLLSDADAFTSGDRVASVSGVRGDFDGDGQLDTATMVAGDATLLVNVAWASGVTPTQLDTQIPVTAAGTSVVAPTLGLDVRDVVGEYEDDLVIEIGGYAVTLEGGVDVSPWAESCTSQLPAFATECGGMSPDGCWCDAQCSTFEDCCSDYSAVCVDDAVDPFVESAIDAASANLTAIPLASEGALPIAAVTGSAGSGFGVFLDRQWILTAASIVGEADEPEDLDVEQGEATVEIASVARHPVLPLVMLAVADPSLLTIPAEHELPFYSGTDAELGEERVFDDAEATEVEALSATSAFVDERWSRAGSLALFAGETSALSALTVEPRLWRRVEGGQGGGDSVVTLPFAAASGSLTLGAPLLTWNGALIGITVGVDLTSVTHRTADGVAETSDVARYYQCALNDPPLTVPADDLSAVQWIAQVRGGALRKDGNGDGYEDLWGYALEDPINRLVMVPMEGTVATGAPEYVGASPTGGDWELTARGVMGPGMIGEFWREPSYGGVYIRVVTGEVSPFGLLFLLDPEWEIAAVADLDGDHVDDVLLRSELYDSYYFWLMEPFDSFDPDTAQHEFSTAIRYGQWFDGPATGGQELLAAGPFAAGAAADGGDEAAADLLWRDPSTGAVTLWAMTMHRRACTSEDDPRLQESCEAYATDELLTYDLVYSVGLPAMPTYFSPAGVADFDGDGAVDLGWHASGAEAPVGEAGEVRLWLGDGLGAFSELEVLDTDGSPLVVDPGTYVLGG